MLGHPSSFHFFFFFFFFFFFLSARMRNVRNERYIYVTYMSYANKTQHKAKYDQSWLTLVYTVWVEWIHFQGRQLCQNCFVHF